MTFLDSLLERLIEEIAKGDSQSADAVRETMGKEIGVDLKGVQPGSGEAERLTKSLKERGLWSPYLEVGIGPDAEIFTKASSRQIESGPPETATTKFWLKLENKLH